MVKVRFRARVRFRLRVRLRIFEGVYCFVTHPTP